eukprot:7512588-Pyramimonas_sp.AAC.1
MPRHCPHVPASLKAYVPSYDTLMGVQDRPAFDTIRRSLPNVSTEGGTTVSGGGEIRGGDESRQSRLEVVSKH